MRAVLEGWRPYAALLVLGLLILAPGIRTLPPLDRDESRFAQASRQMLESGDLIDIRFQDEPRYKKPVAVYWLQAASAALFSRADAAEIWPYRLPSLAGALAAVLLTFAIGRRLFDPPTAFAAAVLLACSLLLNLEARQAKTDAVLLATICVAQLCLAHVYLAGRVGGAPARGAALLLWAALGFGILVKGPVIVLVTGLTALTLAIFDRDRAWLRHLRPIAGLALVVAITGPWLAAIAIRSGGAFFTEAIGHDLGPKLIAAQESHGAPPGYYLLLFGLSFWPGSLLALAAAPFVWRERARPAIRFCLAWLVPTWIFFEILPTKLPHYVLPTYPAIALLAAASIHAGIAPLQTLAARRWRLAATSWWLAITAILVAAIAGISPLATQHVNGLGIVLALITAVLAYVLLHAFRAGRWKQFLAAAAATALCLYPGLFGLLLPRLDPLWLSRSLREAIIQAAGPGAHRVSSSGFSEPSLVFLLGQDTRFVDGGSAAQLLARGGVDLAIVTGAQEKSFQNEIAELGAPIDAIAHVSGINYSNGRRVAATIYHLRPGAPAPSK